ncbi:hypothetical protein [Pseudomonas fontis]|uniref:Zinc-ribbon domain-containing protein n=1 Tax=Pseudomonas fontis TaxID=2942633 RepID=A0ABT5P199_9PSED|nr:hypothetical protein [Pseudomonas fontis]MDD0977589.1 hypothetical protein [Pseudomonas fontis]MDD0994244.1 hypothetical protein [Pseudomonas fontis]
MDSASNDHPSNPPQHPVLSRSPRLRAAVQRFGLVCLDQQWLGAKAQYRFRCARNHEFVRLVDSLCQPKAGGCRVCVVEDRDTRLFKLAGSAGVQCLEARWLGRDVAHRFRCHCGREWTRIGSHVLRSANCPSCKVRRHGQCMRLKDGLSRLQQTAAARGGTCLASRYEGGGHTYAFRCAQGHTWQSLGREVMRRSWCPECARLRKVVNYRHQDGLALLQQKAAARGGVCLSDTYNGSIARYHMRCAQGHEWMAGGKLILRGNWCAACAHDAKRLSIDDAHQAAAARGGQCLAQVYVNSTTKLHWLCHRGHSWHAALAAIRAGHWCAECAYMAKITNPDSKAWRRYRNARD